MSVRVSSLVWGRSKAKGTVFLLMLALADQANDAGTCWPSHRTLVRRLRMSSDRGVRKVIQQAIDLGELQTEEQFQNGRQTSNRYHILLDVLARNSDLWEEGGEPQFQGGGTTVPGGRNHSSTPGGNPSSTRNHQKEPSKNLAPSKAKTEQRSEEGKQVKGAGESGAVRSPIFNAIVECLYPQGAASNKALITRVAHELTGAGWTDEQVKAVLVWRLKDAFWAKKLTLPSFSKYAEDWKRESGIVRRVPAAAEVDGDDEMMTRLFTGRD